MSWLSWLQGITARVVDVVQKAARPLAQGGGARVPGIAGFASTLADGTRVAYAITPLWEYYKLIYDISKGNLSEQQIQERGERLLRLVGIVEPLNAPLPFVPEVPKPQQQRPQQDPALLELQQLQKQYQQFVHQWYQQWQQPGKLPGLLEQWEVFLQQFEDCWQKLPEGQLKDQWRQWLNVEREAWESWF